MREACAASYSRVGKSQHSRQMRDVNYSNTYLALNERANTTLKVAYDFDIQYAGELF